MSIVTQLSAGFLAILMGSAGSAVSVSAQEAGTPAEQSQPSTMEVNLKRGELLSIIMPQVGEASGEARAEYAKVLRLARHYGLRPEGGFRLNVAVPGEYTPDGAFFYSWPSSANESAFTGRPDWPGFKALRRDAWDELNIFTAELDQDVTLRFDPDKFYTMAIAWTNPERPDDYARYMQSIQPQLRELGARMIHSIFDPEFESKTSSRGAPARITLVEWPSVDSLRALRQSAEYKKNNQPLFENGVAAFEFYQIDPIRG